MEIRNIIEQLTKMIGNPPINIASAIAQTWSPHSMLDSTLVRVGF